MKTLNRQCSWCDKHLGTVPATKVIPGYDTTFVICKVCLAKYNSEDYDYNRESNQ
jgi:protein-arginine kinase activator protein McsA